MDSSYAVDVQRLMGHSNVTVTLNIYTDVFNKYKESELEKVNNYYLNNEFFKKEYDIPDNADLTIKIHEDKEHILL